MPDAGLQPSIPQSSPDPPPSPALPRRFFAASLIAGLFFVAWSFFVGPRAIPAFDRDCAEWCATWCDDQPNVRNLMVYVTDVGSIAALSILAVIGAVWQFTLKRRFLVALVWLGVVFGGALLNYGLKTAIDRPRPSAELRDRAIHETNASYPSGHSMGSAVGYGMLAYALLLTQPGRRHRIATVLLVAGLVVAIGCSRFMLRAHWLSDVVGGWAIGAAWLCFCLGLMEWRQLWRAQLAI